MSVIFANILFSLFLGGNVHEYFFSHTDIIEKENSFEISTNIFIDDLDNMFKKKGYQNLKLGTEQEAKTADQLINDYLQKNLKLIVNEERVNWDWIGKEVSEDLMSFWIYVEVIKKGKTNSFIVDNKTLTDAIDDQKNIVNVVLMDNTKRYLLFDKSSRPKVIK